MVFLPREPVQLVGLDAELLGVAIPVVDQELDTLGDVLDNPAHKVLVPAQNEQLVTLPVEDLSPVLESNQVLPGSLRGAVDFCHPVLVGVLHHAGVDEPCSPAVAGVEDPPGVAGVGHLLVDVSWVELSGVGTKKNTLGNLGAVVDDAFTSALDVAAGHHQLEVREFGEDRGMELTPVHLGFPTTAAEDDRVDVLQVLLQVGDGAPWTELRAASCSK